MAEKKSLFEKLGLIEPVQGEQVEEKKETMEPIAAREEEKAPKPVAPEIDGKKIEERLDVLIGSYEKNKFQSIDEIYNKANLVTDKKKSIFMADIYLKALPENLPADIKRESVLNIMEATQISVDELLNDAYKRIDALNTVVEETVQSTESMVNKHMSTIRDLELRIAELKEHIEERKRFEQQQNTSIEFEIQKIINIVDFIKPKSM